MQYETEHRAADNKLQEELDECWCLEDVQIDEKAMLEDWLKRSADNSTTKESNGKIINFLPYDEGEKSITSFIKRLEIH